MYKKVISLVLLILLMVPTTVNAETDTLEISYYANRSNETTTPTVWSAKVGDTGTKRIIGYYEYAGGHVSGTQHASFFLPQSIINKATVRGILWNTKPDGSGYDIRGGRILTQKDYEIIKDSGSKLYQVWASAVSISGNLNAPTPTVLLNGKGNYRTKETALELNPTDNVTLGATLKQNLTQSKVIWGRLDKWGDNETSKEKAKDKGIYGTVTIEILADLEMASQKNFVIEFSSPWLEIDHDAAQRDEANYVSRLTVSTDEFQKSGRTHRLNIPVKLVDKSILAQMDKEDFLKDMSFNIFTKEPVLNFFDSASLVDVAKSQDPYIGFSGRVNLTIKNKDEANARKLKESVAPTQYIKLLRETVSNVSVNYEDVFGNKIAESEVLEGLVGDDFTAKIKDIAGYTYSHENGQINGTFTYDEQTITIVYKPNMDRKSELTIEYIDSEGNEIKAKDVLYIETGKTYNITAPDITGYEYVRSEGELSGVKLDEGRMISLVYEKNKAAESQLTVKYVDSEGNEIKAKDTSYIEIGERYDIIIPDITGYDYVRSEGELNGIKLDTDQEVTLIYSKNGEGTVTVKYEDLSGKEISKPYSLSGKLGDKFSIEKKKITGYTLEKVQGELDGVFTKESQEVILTYKKDALLPDTGAPSLLNNIAIGLIVLGLGVGIIGKRKRKV